MPDAPKSSNSSAAKLRGRAEDLLRKSPRDVGLMASGDIQALVQELQVHQIELEMQNDELHRAQAELQESRDRFVDLFDFAPIGYLSIDNRGVIMQANLTAGILLKTARGKLIGRQFREFVVPDHRIVWREHQRALFGDEDSLSAEPAGVPAKQTCELAIHGEPGEEIWLRLESFVVVRNLPARNADRQPTVQCRTALLDITQQRVSVESLRESEQRLRLALEAADMGVFTLDLRDNIVRMDERMRTLWGLTSCSQPVDAFFERMPPDDAAAARVDLANLITGVRLPAREFRTVVSDGVRWVSTGAALLRDDRGRPRLIVGASVDITTRKAAELAQVQLSESLQQLTGSLEEQVQQRTRELQKKEEQLRAVLDTATDAIITINRHGRIQSINPSAERIFGYSQDDIVGRPIRVLIPSFNSELRIGKIGSRHEVQGLRTDGSSLPLEVAISEVAPNRLFTLILHDISQRKELEREIVEVAALEQERIGQELHDSVGQELTGLSLMADALRQRLKTGGTDDQRIATRVTDGLGRVHEQIRNLSRGLIPVPVGPEGLSAALDELAEHLNHQPNTRCTIRCPAPIPNVDVQTATQLFRIAQEATSNSIRHGRAKLINITLKSQDNSLILSIADDGVGIAPSPTGSGVGLRIMRHRAAVLGGELHVGPVAGGGTIVTCTISTTPQ